MLKLRYVFALLLTFSFGQSAQAAPSSPVNQGALDAALTPIRERLRSIDNSLDDIETQLETATTKVEVTNHPTPAPIPAPPAPPKTWEPQYQTFSFDAPVAWCRLLKPNQDPDHDGDAAGEWKQEPHRFSTIACKQDEVKETCVRFGYDTFRNAGFTLSLPEPVGDVTYVWAPFRKIICARSERP